MSKYTITAVDTTGIQDYIFGSNRLQENIGASELVRQATEQWALEAVMKVVASNAHNIADAAALKLKEGPAKFRIDEQSNEQAAEVLYVGGGNVVILFGAAEVAKDFAFTLTERVLKDAPGLSLVIAHHHGFDFVQHVLSDAVQDLLGIKLGARKAGRLPSAPLLGLGVTATCDSSGLVAAVTNKGIELGEGEPRLPRVPLSLEVAAKRRKCDDANGRLGKLMTPEQRKAFNFPSQLDDLGREFGQESYIAVVHADGNRVGEKIQKIAADHREPTKNRAYIQAIRGFSRKTNEAGEASLKEIIGLLTRHPDQSGNSVLPLRPLVFGGDDVTFVCRGNLGVPLAAAYLDAFERHTEEKLYASAGIAIVKMHYPFARAYKLSEALAKSAKRYLRELNRDASALDWHFAPSGLSGSLEEIREREYNSPEGQLLLRPLLLKPEEQDQEGRAWIGRVEKLVLTFQDDRDRNKGEPKWSGRRNKLKALREALRAGQQSVRDFRRNYLDGDPLPGFVPGESYQESGWHANRCGYFDALELFDHYEQLTKREEQEHGD
jgi:hypothetical protein